MIRRVNILAGPGAGKSTLCAKLYAELKSQGHSVELATEYVKGWAYLKRDIRPFDQFYLLNKQLQKEYVPLQAGVDLVVSDSPLFLPYCYATLDFEPKVADLIAGMVDLFDEQYPSLYLFLERSTVYDGEGRYQSEEDAIKIDERIKTCLQMRNKDYITITLNDDVTALVRQHLQTENKADR